MFNPLNFTLNIQYIYDSGIYYTIVDKKKLDAPTLEKLFERVIAVIKRYKGNHLLNDTDWDADRTSATSIIEL